MGDVQLRFFYEMLEKLEKKFLARKTFGPFYVF